MTKIYTLPDVPILDASSYQFDYNPATGTVAERDTITDEKTGDQTTTYVMPLSEIGFNTDFVVRQAKQKRGGALIKRPSLTINTYIVETDDVTGAVVHDPVSCSIAFTYPDGRPVSPQLLLQLAMEAFARLASGGADNLVDTRIASLQHGITRILS